VTVTVKTAEGLEAAQTRVKFKSVDVGVLRAVRLASDRASVIAVLELTSEAESLLVEDTRFWVVRPRIAGGQVSGLGTLLSGSFIGMDPGKSQESRHLFTGLETAPAVTADLPGRAFTLYSEELGSLDVGSPVYFRRFQVGEVVAAELDKDGGGVRFTIFVHAPYHRYVSTTTRFWHASGIDVAVDASGLRLRTESLVSVLLGGIAFQEPDGAPSGKPAEDKASFALARDRVEAFKRIERESEIYVLVFDQSVRGLAVGAPVDLRGLVVGEVTDISIEYGPDASKVHMRVEVRVYPGRMRSRAPDGSAVVNDPTAPERLQRAVDRGFRAQLRTGNLLTGQLYVAVDYFKGQSKVVVDPSRTPLEIPTIPGSFEELQMSVANVVRTLEKVPFDRIAEDVRVAVRSLDSAVRSVDKLAVRLEGEVAPELSATLQDTGRLMKRLDAEVAPDMQATLVQARAMLANAERVLAADAPLQADLRQSLRDLSRALEAVRSLADWLERHPESLIRGKAEDGR